MIFPVNYRVVTLRAGSSLHCARASRLQADADAISRLIGVNESCCIAVLVNNRQINIRAKKKVYPALAAVTIGQKSY